MRIIDPMQYERIVFFTGPGMSAESGMPTYRGRGGVCNQYRTYFPNFLGLLQVVDDDGGAFFSVENCLKLNASEISSPVLPRIT